jgi:flagellar biosynthetic protein FliQ
MSQSTVLALMQQTIEVMLLVSAPALSAGLVVGLAVSVTQVMTSIQDSTLSLLPRIIAMILAAYITLPWMLRTLTGFTIRLYDFLPTVAH